MIHLSGPWDYPFIRVAFAEDGFDRVRRIDNQKIELEKEGLVEKLLSLNELDKMDFKRPDKYWHQDDNEEGRQYYY